MSHLKRTIRIHAPLETVYGTARDPGHWSDWYVGISEERDLGVGPGGEHRSVMVGTPFPLTQRVLEDRLGRTEAHWRARGEDAPECVEVAPLCSLMMLSGEYDWTYKSADGETEVTAVLDFTLPSKLLKDAGDRSAIERIEAECLEQSLENLRRVCEISH